MAKKIPHVKNDDKYEAQREKGMSKEISNSYLHGSEALCQWHPHFYHSVIMGGGC